MRCQSSRGWRGGYCLHQFAIVCGAAGVECEMSQQQGLERLLLGFDSATLQGRPAYQRDGLHVYIYF